MTAGQIKTRIAEIGTKIDNQRAMLPGLVSRRQQHDTKRNQWIQAARNCLTNRRSSKDCVKDAQAQVDLYTGYRSAVEQDIRRVEDNIARYNKEIETLNERLKAINEAEQTLAEKGLTSDAVNTQAQAQAQSELMKTAAETEQSAAKNQVVVLIMLGVGLVAVLGFAYWGYKKYIK
jgi:chromosome segregation ATPase